MNDMVDVMVNGEARAVARGATLLELLESLALDPRAVVVEHNRTIVRRPRLGAVTVAPGDAIELVHFVGGGWIRDIPFTIGGRSFHSRLMVGTGKYRDNDTMARAIEASGAEIVTVAVRRVDLDRTKEEGVLYHLDAKRYFLLANTAGCYTAEDAVRYARLAREAGFNEFIKLEVIGDQETLLPDVQGLLVAARTLVAEGFKVLAYTNEDLVTALRLEDAGCAAVMPLASPIGSGLGLLNPFGVRTIKRRLKVPVVVDAGVGTASDACLTMEQGVDGILMNTALAAARDPVAMARAMRLAVEAGRAAYLAGRMPKREVAVPSSPLEGMLD